MSFDTFNLPKIMFFAKIFYMKNILFFLLIWNPVLLETNFFFSIHEIERRIRGEKPRVAIPSVLAGIGHIKALEALCRGLEDVAGEVELQSVNPLNSFSPRLPELINRLYLWIIESPFRGLFGALCESALLAGPKSPLGIIVAKIYAQSIKNILDDFNAEIIISTHPHIAAGVSLLKSEGIIDIPLVSVATDYDVHPLGISEEVDVFIVPDDSIKLSLQERGVAGEKIKVLGIPIDPKFNKKVPKSILRKKLGIRTDLPTVLILGGGFGIGPIEEVVRSFENYKSPLQLVVIAGRNEALREKIQKIKEDLEIGIEVFGYVENIEEFMGASDLLVTKPGGVTIAEAFAKSLPLILIEPIGPQEEKNMNFVVEHGVGIYAEQIEDIPKIINNFFSNPRQLELMKIEIQKLAHPNSAIEIAKLILKIRTEIKQMN
jgi:processive 1,2-diacylglycerol beta-glucosyltransferase